MIQDESDNAAPLQLVVCPRRDCQRDNARQRDERDNQGNQDGIDSRGGQGGQVDDDDTANITNIAKMMKPYRAKIPLRQGTKKLTATM